ncbi:MAG TPA: class II aldolase/adducin family protein [Acidobacteriota bacterium]|nr:class II aldolase/adducin family protein [Acidobacteriota bacterium]
METHLHTEHVDDGYVKYHCVWTKAQPLAPDQLTELNHWRQQMYYLHLIGAYTNHVGFGNVSVRIPGTNKFIISGTETGNLKFLDESHYCIVTATDIANNTLYCTGPIRASSEAMTHAAIYNADADAMAVIHVHSPTMWEALKGKLHTTDENATYGTPAMAGELTTAATKKLKEKLVVMGGHKEGLIAWGPTIADAGKVIIKHYEKLKLNPSHT